MNYFWLAPKDQRWNNWILHIESEGGVRLRPRYVDRACRRCRKLDEMAAVRSGLDPDVRLRTRFDFVGVDDGFVCMSTELVAWLTDEGVQGIAPVALPGDSRFSVVLPEREAYVNVERSGMEFRRACGVCGRVGETCLFPALAAIELPENPLALICPAVPMEGRAWRNFWFLAAAPLVDLLKKQPVRGVEFNKAY